jgi:hypothetical protein
LLTLVGGCLLLWALIALPLFVYQSSRPAKEPAPEAEASPVVSPEVGLLQSTVAALLCLLPTAATLLWCDLVLRGTPEQQLAAVLGGTGLRMVFVVGAALALFYNMPEYFGFGRFWLWVIVFYLATLALEMVLVVRRQAAMDQAPNNG